MIASLRRRHRWTFLALTAILPILVAAAYLKRPEMPTSGLSGELLVHTAGEPLASAEAGFASHRGQLNRYASSVELIMDTALRSPDVLVYFSASAQEGIDDLPEDARLLGALDPAQPNLYALEASADGRLLLYSLGHQILIDSAALPALAAAQPADSTKDAAQPPADDAAEDLAGDETGGAS